MHTQGSLRSTKRSKLSAVLFRCTIKAQTNKSNLDENQNTLIFLITKKNQVVSEDYTCRIEGYVFNSL